MPLPEGLTPRAAMAVGTAGFTAMLAIMALEDHGLTPRKGEVLVTGAAGGVGSVATAALATLGYEVAAVTGRPEQEEYLKGLGAARIGAARGAGRDGQAPAGGRDMGPGCVDAVGGAMLARVLGQMKYGCSVAAVGLAGGAQLPATVVPFLLRGREPSGHRQRHAALRTTACRAWERVARDVPQDKLEAMIEPAGLGDLPELGAAILKGGVRGRVVVDVRS